MQRIIQFKTETEQTDAGTWIGKVVMVGEGALVLTTHECASETQAIHAADHRFARGMRTLFDSLG